MNPQLYKPSALDKELQGKMENQRLAMTRSDVQVSIYFVGQKGVLRELLIRVKGFLWLITRGKTGESEEETFHSAWC